MLFWTGRERNAFFLLEMDETGNKRGTMQLSANETEGRFVPGNESLLAISGTFPG